MSGAADLQQIVTGLTRMARTRPDMALRQARSLLEQFPRLVPVQCLAANLARHAGDLEGVERHLEAALAEDPEAPPALAEIRIQSLAEPAAILAASPPRLSAEVSPPGFEPAPGADPGDHPAQRFHRLRI